MNAGKALLIGGGLLLANNLLNTGTAGFRLTYDFRNTRFWKSKTKPRTVEGTFELYVANPTGTELRVSEFFTSINRYDRLVTSVSMRNIIAVNNTGQPEPFSSVTIPARGDVTLLVGFSFPYEQLASDIEQLILGKDPAPFVFKGSLKANGIVVPFTYSYSIAGVDPNISGPASLEADGGETVINGNGYTKDIVNAIVNEYNKSWKQVKDNNWAEQFRRDSVAATIKNLHNWRWKNLQYIEDPIGLQYIKSPARILADGYADCKGFSIMLASILTALDIPVYFRFVSYRKDDPMYTHVYVMVQDQGALRPVDWCLRQPFTEKGFAHKLDIMPKIIRLSGPSVVDTTIDWNNNTLANVRAKQALEAAQLEAEIMAAGGQVSGFQDEKMAYLEALVSATETAAVSGIGKIQLPKPGSGAVKAATQKVTQAVTQAVTAPVRAVKKLAANVAQDIMEKLLPVFAPAFLYLFVQADIAAKLPASEQAKRNRQIRLAKAIQKAVGIPEDVFMNAVRNGIMKKMNGTPDSIIKAAFAGQARVSGPAIGFLDPATLSLIMTAGKKVFDAIKNHIATKKAAKEADAEDLAFEKDSFSAENYLPDLSALAGASGTAAYQASQQKAANAEQPAGSYAADQTASRSADSGSSDTNKLLLPLAAVAAIFLLSKN